MSAAYTSLSAKLWLKDPSEDDYVMTLRGKLKVNAAAEEQQLLEECGVNAAAMIWVHAQNDYSGKYHFELAERGCWISLDGLNSDDVTMDDFIQLTVLNPWQAFKIEVNAINKRK